MATNNKNKVLNVPPLRFPEFTEEWKRFRVSDLLEFYSTNSLSWEQLDYNNGKILNLHYGLIHVGLPTLVDITRDSLPFIKYENSPKNFTLCKNGDVVFADASEDTDEVAKAIEFSNVDDKEIVCGLHTIHGRDINNVTVVGYKGYAFASPVFHNQIRRIAQGTKIYSINNRNFSECYIGIPGKIEQQRIVRLLSLIDERIATQNKIIENLKSLIGGLADTFTSHGEPTKISDCVVCNSSSLQENKLSETGMYPVYGASGVVGYVDICDYSADAILIVKDGSSVGTVSRVGGKYSFIGTLNLLSAKNGYYLPYLYYSLKAFNFKPYVTGMAIPHIYFKDYGNAKISCPSYCEQVKIGNALSAIETKLDVENQILASLSKQKSYLLQRLFI